MSEPLTKLNGIEVSTMIISPDKLYLDAAEIAQQILASDFRPNVVIPVSPKARVFAHIVQSYLCASDDTCKFVEGYGDYDRLYKRNGNKNVLLVGRMMGTGESYKAIHDFLKFDMYSNVEYACQFYIPKLNKDTHITPKYYNDVLDNSVNIFYPEDLTFSDLIALFG